MSNTVSEILREEKIKFVQMFVDIDLMLYNEIKADTLQIAKVQNCQIDNQNKVSENE